MRRYASGILTMVLAGGVILAGVIGWGGSNQVLRPPWYEHRKPSAGLRPVEGTDFGTTVWQGVVHDPKTDLGLAYEDVSFPTRDGSTLRGWLVPSGGDARVGIVAVHGGGGDRRDFLRHARIFHEGGYPFLLFDCREHGVSDGADRGVSFGVREHEDVIAAVHFVRAELGWSRTGVIGTSMGAVSTILAAAKDSRIEAVVAENPFTSLSDLLADSRLVRDGTPRWILELVSAVTLWRVGGLDQPSVTEVVDEIAPRPLLLIHGTADDIVPPNHSERLYERAGEPKALWLAPGAGHAMIVNEYPEEYRERVIGFFDRWLRAPPEG